MEEKGMKRFCLAVGLLALVMALGCGDKETVVRIKEVPDVDHSAIDEYVEIGEMKVDSEGLLVLISGTAKAAMGTGIAVKVDRFRGSTKVDTVNSRIAQGKLPEMPVGSAGPPSEGERPPPPGFGEGPPPIPPIEVGDPVTISIDATMEGGRISKLVIRPAVAMTVPVGPG